DRLQPVAALPPQQEFSGYPAAANAPAVAAPAEPARVSVPVVPIAAPNPVVAPDERAQRPRPGKASVSSRRTVLLGVLLATLGAWFYYGQPGDQIAALIAVTNDAVVARLPDTRSRAVETTASVPVQSVATERVAPADAPAAPSTTDDTAPVVTDVIEPKRVDGADPMPVDSVQAADDTTPAAPANEESSARDEATALITDVAAAEAGVDQVEPAPALAFAEPIISVSERDGAARIAVPNTGHLEAPLVWWTSEHSAKAGEDFIGVDQQVLAATTKDDGNVLFVPLVNDSLPEPPKSFFVSLGFSEPHRGRIERIATVRVDIVDDD
ncbi:MAG: hypothetical protein KJO95_12975, partial [Gammaproteobacteria bacterium]|nr:hypothetical protein [Gammaproteobacteria bacterium]